MTLAARVQKALRSASTIRGVDVALVPAVAYTEPDKLALSVPVLFGWDLPGEHQLVIAHGLVYQMRLGVPRRPGPL